MDPDKTAAEVVAKFMKLAAYKNFLPFEDLELELNISRNTLLSLKGVLEDALREKDSRVMLTSRIDLEPPGFEIAD